MFTDLRERIAGFFDDRKNITLVVLAAIFLLFFFVPFEEPRVSGALHEGFVLLQEYVREHVLLCLVPAFFIAGAIMEFANQQAVLRFLGPQAPKPVSYSVGAVSGTVLAVCSCTVLPIFKGIYRKGAGIGPATAFLYSGPAINVLAIILTAKVLGPRLGIARAVAAVVFAVVLGTLMHLLFRKSDAARATDADMFEYDEKGGGILSRTTLVMAALIGFLVFINWPAPQAGGSSGGSGVAGSAGAESAAGESGASLWSLIHDWRVLIAVLFLVLLAVMLRRRYRKSEIHGWLDATKDFAVQIVPLLFAGVLIAGFLLGRPGEPGIIPQEWIAAGVGGNSWRANAVASVIGALMYFATLTEVPILHGLIGAGMGQGPALALLLAGPSLSLPSLLVIGGELGMKKTIVYVLLVVVLSTVVGYSFGSM